MAGRPKRTFSEEQVQEIERMARLNCYTETIANALDIPVNTLKRHFGRKMRQKRAEGKVGLRQNQGDLAKTSADMAKFLGKNVLGQVEKQVIETKLPKTDMTEAEKEASVAAAKVYKLKLA